MGIEVQSGAAVTPEQVTAISSSTRCKPDRKTSSNNKDIIIVVSIGILCLAGILIGVIHDWSGNDGNGKVKVVSWDREDINVATTRRSGHDSNGKGAGRNREDRTVANTRTVATTRKFASSTGPFNVSVPLFSPDIIKGYASIEEARADFEEMAKFVLNGGISSASMIPMRGQEPPIMMAPEAASGGSAAAAPAVGNTATDFETNNQEANVDKADLAKSNGEFLFAAYGDYLLVMEVASGTIINRIQMDPVEIINECDPNMSVYPVSEPLIVKNESLVDETAAVDGEGETTPSFSKSMPWNPCFYRPKPYIQSLAVAGDRLTVVVSGYGLEYTQNLQVQPIFWEYLSTRILVYDINGGKMILLSTKDVNGYFLNAYTIGGYTHVVTQAGLNSFDTLLAPIQRWQPAFEGMSDDEYKTEVTRLAEEELIPKFVDQLIADIQVAGVDLNNLVRLSLFSNSVSSQDDLEMSLWGGGYANSLTHVTSFDMNQPQVKGDKLVTSIAATFLPTSWGHVYSNEEMLFVAGQGWDWIAARGASGQTTYLVGFELQGAKSSAKVTGSVPGYLLNPYSLDFHNGYLRVATTQNFWTWTWRPLDMVVLDEVEPQPAAKVNASSSSNATTSQPNRTETVNPDDGIIDDTASLTLNQIIILKVPTTVIAITNEDESSQYTLKQVGSVNLGKKNEMFTTVRFFDTIAYAVTFERTDPFYVLDLSNEETPVVLGELEIPGFSSYLHSINADNTKLLAVGQHANDDGVVLGLKISLFDATIPTKPQLLAEHIEEKQVNAYSNSEVEWDQAAFRYLNLGEYGRLIIPMSIYVWHDVGPIMPAESESELVNNSNTSSSTTTSIVNQGGNFDGFAVFSVANDKIERQFYISHSQQTVEYTPGCWSCGWLAPRSFVFNGDVVTMKGQSILRTDLDTGDAVWDINVEKMDGGLLECCGY